MATKIVYVSPFEMAERLRHELKDNKTVGVQWVKKGGDITSRAVRHPSYNPPPGTAKRGKVEGDLGKINVRDMTKANAIYDAFNRYSNGEDLTEFQSGIIKRARISFEGLTLEALKKLVPLKTWTKITLSNLVSVKAEGVTYKLINR